MDVVVNKKAGHLYHLTDTFLAGLSLEGWEVKSLQRKKILLDNAYIKITNGEAFLFGATITPETTTNQATHADPVRDRKLLLTRRELDKLIGLVEQDGYTLVPIKITKERRYKLVFALAKGKKLHDKRQDAKDKEWARTRDQMHRQDQKRQY